MFYCDAVHERAARRNRDLVDHFWPGVGLRIVATRRTKVGARETNSYKGAQQPPRTYAKKVFVADCQSRHNLLNSHALLRPSECVVTHVDQAMKRPMYIGNGY